MEVPLLTRSEIGAIAEAERIKRGRVSESRIRAAATRKRRSERAWSGAACGGTV